MGKDTFQTILREMREHRKVLMMMMERFVRMDEARGIRANSNPENVKLQQDINPSEAPTIDDEDDQATPKEVVDSKEDDSGEDESNYATGEEADIDIEKDINPSEAPKIDDKDDQATPKEVVDSKEGDSGEDESNYETVEEADIDIEKEKDVQTTSQMKLKVEMGQMMSPQLSMKRLQTPMPGSLIQIQTFKEDPGEKPIVHRDNVKELFFVHSVAEKATELITAIDYGNLTTTREDQDYDLYNARQLKPYVPPDPGKQ